MFGAAYRLSSIPDAIIAMIPENSNESANKYVKKPQMINKSGSILGILVAVNLVM